MKDPLKVIVYTIVLGAAAYWIALQIQGDKLGTTPVDPNGPRIQPMEPQK